MRPVAIITALLLLLLSVTTVEADHRRLNEFDECSNHSISASTNNCIRFDQRSAPEELEDGGKYWFLWLGIPPATVSESRNVFTGQQALVPVLYGDTNGLEGLQRKAGNYGGHYLADNVVLL